jgi:hypothetical protein
MRSKFFYSSYIKTFSIFWLKLAPFERFMVNFSKSYPFKGARAGYACLFGLIHLLHTELMQSETPCQLSQHGVRLHVNWVNAEWDSMSTGSMQKAPTLTNILSFCVDLVNAESHSVLTLSTWSLTWRWLSWWGMRLRVNWFKNKIKNTQKPNYLQVFLSVQCLEE